MAAEQRLLLFYDVSIEDVLQRVATHSGFASAPIPSIQPAVEKITVADARWMTVSAGEETPSRLPLFLRELRDIPEPLRPYVISVADRTIEHQILPEGVDDLILLPIAPVDLLQILRPARRFIRLQTEFRRQALRDPLTGALNRRAVLNMLERELPRSRRLGYPVAVAMIDIDRYKEINDAHGHLAGDAAMVALASRLQAQLRPYDAVGRYGGDEFLLVLTNCSLEQGKIICERIRAGVHSTRIVAPGASLQISISIGLTAADVGEAPEPSMLIQRADLALYEAKNTGRDKVVVAP